MKSGLKAGAYHNLGLVARRQGRWKQAEQYYQQALYIKIEYNDRYSQANTYGQLGQIAIKCHEWKKSEEYFQRALQIDIEFNNRHRQAITYCNLGIGVQEQGQWKQARDYFLQALEIFREYNDTYNGGMVMHSLAQLWRDSGDVSVLAMVAERFEIEVSEVEKLLRKALEKDGEDEKEN